MLAMLPCRARNHDGARCAGKGIWLLVLLSRGWLEAHMARHMLLQFPLLLLGGMLLAGWLPLVWRRRISLYNQLGLNGMGVRIVADQRVDDSECAGSGAGRARHQPGQAVQPVSGWRALRLSWQPAGRAARASS